MRREGLLVVFLGSVLALTSGAGAPNAESRGDRLCPRTAVAPAETGISLQGAGQNSPCGNACAWVRQSGRSQQVEYEIPCCTYRFSTLPCCRGYHRTVHVVYECRPVQNPCALEDGRPIGAPSASGSAIAMTRRVYWFRSVMRRPVIGSSVQVKGVVFGCHVE